MNKIEQEHLEAISNSIKTTVDAFEPRMFTEVDNAAIRCSLITKRIAIEFAEWIINHATPSDHVINKWDHKYLLLNSEELFEEFLKTLNKE